MLDYDLSPSETKIIIYFIGFVVCGINYFVVFTEKKYEELAKKYKYEIHKSLKGWGIISYFIVSIILIVVSGFVLEVSI